jgi:hypothetical protein
VITDACLNDCVEALADNADLPSEAELAAVTPGLAERHGVPTTRAMFATAVLGEAPASAAILKILKNDPALTLPS